MSALRFDIVHCVNDSHGRVSPQFDGAHECRVGNGPELRPDVLVSGMLREEAARWRLIEGYVLG